MIPKQLYVHQEKLSKLKKYKESIEKFPDWVKYVKLNFLYELVPSLDTKKRISRAFYKLYEIQSDYKIIKDSYRNSLCICEAPGGFVEAIVNINKSIKCDSQSLNDGNIVFSNRIKPTKELNGDITELSTQIRIIKHSINIGKYDFITADGGIDCSNNYYIQEQLNTKLIMCQINVILYSLKKSGNCIVKIFDSFTLPTLQIIFLLEQHFEIVKIVKPILSRPCNSEKYILCFNYKGINNLPSASKFINNDKFINDLGVKLNQEFIQRVERMNNNFVDMQIFHLNDTLNYNKPYNDQKQKQYKMSKKMLDRLKIHNH